MHIHFISRYQEVKDPDCDDGKGGDSSSDSGSDEAVDRRHRRRRKGCYRRESTPPHPRDDRVQVSAVLHPSSSFLGNTEQRVDGMALSMPPCVCACLEPNAAGPQAFSLIGPLLISSCCVACDAKHCPWC